MSSIMEWSFERKLLAIAGVGAVLRLVWALIVPIEPVSDSYIYWVTSSNIVTHGVYGITPEKPFSYWPVGTSAIYAAGYSLLGINMISVKIINVVAGVLLIITTGKLAKRWYGEHAGLVAAAILALWPSLIMYSSIMASEVFFALFVNTVLLAWVYDQKNWPLMAVVAGIALAAAIYVRPVALLVPVVLVALAYIRWRQTSLRPIVFGMIALATSTACLAPWVARNYAVHDAFVLVSTNGGPNLWMGNNPETIGGYMKLPEYTKEMTEIERAEVLGELAKRHIVENPVKTASLFFQRLYQTHYYETIAVVWNEKGLKERLGEWVLLPLKLAATGYWLLFFALAMTAVVLVLLRTSKRQTVPAMLQTVAEPALVMFAYYAAVHGLIVGNDRYHFPSIPFVAILAAFAIVTLAGRLQMRSETVSQATQS
ncbi:MAG: glycosyltransferase family 39 protein [Pseudomonadota bacterium]